MLRVVTPLLRQMLHLKLLTINIVTGVTGFRACYIFHTSNVRTVPGSPKRGWRMAVSGQRSKVREDFQGLLAVKIFPLKNPNESCQIQPNRLGRPRKLRRREFVQCLRPGSKSTAS